MAIELDLADIQGNILTAYAHLGFYKGRVLLFHVDDGKAELGRKFVTGLVPRITTALRWPPDDAPLTAEAPVARPKVAINIAFTWYGLLALGIPTRTLRGMPDEFIDGMAARARMLGDDFKGPNWKDSWDEVWANTRLGAKSVHILVMLNAQMNPDGSPVAELNKTTTEILEFCKTKCQVDGAGVRLLSGHNRPGQQHPPADFQELTAILDRDSVGRLKRDAEGRAVPTPKEHFGFTDGISDPVFEGQYPEDEEQVRVQGNGAVDGDGNWRPIATGEFLLGYPDEAQETAGEALPLDFSRNGTFFAYRKLHEDVAAFNNFLDTTAQRFSAIAGISDPKDARDTLMAKMAGRWSDGVPISLAPTADDWRAFQQKLQNMPDEAARVVALTKFTFHDDPDGHRCPLTAHVRRVNTRDAMAPTGTEGSVLNNRRRILRRGLPYGAADTDEHGIVMLAVCASLFRQFEFIQQQWINYGLDFFAGSDTCPIVGNHSDGTVREHGPKAKYVIPADPSSGHLPFVVEGIPQFVETRGGEYFFVPSMTALRMIGMGVVDPT